MAAIYDVVSGYPITQGLEGCRACDQAVQTAIRIAAARMQSVHLEDDDGDWMVHPNGTIERLEVPDAR